MSDKTKVLIAGICSLLLTLGISRFSYTPLLPLMLEQTPLSISWGGWLAAFNYVGYLVGAIIAAQVRSITLKDQLYRAYLIFAVLSTIAMAWTTNVWLWSLLRFIGGVSTSGGMLLGSALVLNWLLRHHYRGELGIHFMGVGGGIALVAALVMALLHIPLDWAEQWVFLAMFGLPLGVVAWLWMPRPDPVGQTTSGQNLKDHPPSKLLEKGLLISYFFAGIGYVVDATFIVDIVERTPTLSGSGPLAFLLVGLGAIPAVLIWDRIARNVGYFKAMMYAYLLQVVGILLPLQGSLVAVIIGALLFGATFVGLVSLVLTLSGRFYPTSPARLMGKMTFAYGLAQIIGPAITGELTEWLGSYVWGLGLAAGCVVIGALINAKLIPLEKNEPALRR